MVEAMLCRFCRVKDIAAAEEVNDVWIELRGAPSSPA